MTTWFILKKILSERFSVTVLGERFVLGFFLFLLFLPIAWIITKTCIFTH